nr:immunoglobulin domain-containing protein [Bacteroidales bacterium]
MKLKYYFVLFLLFNIAQAQNSYVSRALAVLDLTQKNAETNNSNLFSVEHIVKTMGIPYLTTKNLSEAIKYPVILATSDFLDNTFNTAELNTLTNYVNNGGVLIATNIASSKYYSLFGISGYSTSTKRYSLNWIDPSNDSALRWIDDSLELTISLGSKNYDNVISSRSYLLSNSTALAFYDDNTVAAGKNNYGAGSTYFFGISWRMIILFNQFNYDYEAQRIWSEGFEPTSDVVMLFVKGIYAKHVSFAIWKHTAPYDNKAVMIMTHDIDWGQAFDTMRLCADLEKKYKIKTEYFVTTHYIRDDEDSDYYSDSIADVIYVKEQGMNIGSHSVGHFSDFSKGSVFPIGSPGNTKENYYPQYLDGITKNGTCFGECEVSKNLLEQDCGANIRSFRSGFLAFNPNQILVLDSLGYDFNSTQSACDVLTHFPYQQHKEQSFSGRLSRIYEIPLTIDADPVTQENWRSLIDYHLTLIDKIKASNAIINILVHPGRLPKIWYVENLLQRLPKDVFVMNLEDFGDYWKDREVFDFTSTVNNNIMTLSVPDNELPLNPYFSLIINNGKNLSDIVVKSQSGSIIQYFKSDFDANDIVIYLGQPQNTEITILQQPQSQNQCIGNSFPLKVDVSALPPIKYQWYKNNILIQGATGEIYEIKNATNADAGIYYCSVTNEYSHINSNTAKININQIDNTEIKPKEGQSFYYSKDSTLYFCNPIELQIKAVPGADFSYQWFKETDLIAGATNTIFQVSESALYSLEITNSSGCKSKSNILNLVKPENLKAKLSITGSESFCSGQTATLYTKEISNESFESGNFNEFNWQSSGDQVWMIDNSNKYVGSYSAKSGLITHLQSSILTISQYVEKDTEIGFAYRVSSETNYDFLRFYINGKLKGEWSGEVEWTSILFSVNRGYNEFRWVYSKDKSVNTGSDAAWIDNIDFPAKATGLLTYQW